MDAPAEVKSRLNIEDVIGEYVSLKRTGANYKGLSPFTNEKTPSFVVSPDKQIWHDFSSGRGGDVFTFIQEVEGLDFKSALELLARKAGIELEKYQSKSGGRGPNKDRLFDALDQAAKFYQVQLGANKKALEYVAKKRKFTKETILEFRIGYSPNSGDALVNYLSKKGFNINEIKQAGLTANRSGRSSDMFRGRIMVPLCDQFGKPIGFTARLLVDNKNAPKYINTPSTVLYDKSRHVYGLHLAKKNIQKEKFSVLAEGNLDVVSSHQAGIKNVVATAGTALTEMQLKILGRFSPDVRLAFDEDQAGISATERAIPLANKTGVELGVITIPSGKDPDELIQEDPKIWQEIIKKHQYALDWLIGIYSKQLDIESAVGKRKFADRILPVVGRLENEVEKDHYIQKISKLIEVDPNSIKKQMAGKSDDKPKRLKPIKSNKISDKNDIEVIKNADRLLSLAFMLSAIRPVLNGINKDMLISDESKQLYDFLIANPKFDGSKQQLNTLNKIKDYVKIVSLQFDELYAGVDLIELKQEAFRLKSRLIEHYVKHQKKQIMSEMDQSKDQDVSGYLQRVRDLDELLKKSKE